MIIIGNSCTGDDVTTKENVYNGGHRKLPKLEFPETREGIRDRMAYYGTHIEFTTDDLKWVTPSNEPLKES